MAAVKRTDFSSLTLSDAFKAHFEQLRDASRPTPTTGLHTCALNGDLRRAKRILQTTNGDPNAADSTGCTPLHHAALLGRAELVALLLAHGADPNARTGSSSSPLHKAAQGGHAAVIRLLLDAGADHHARNSSGESALDVASARRHTAAMALLGEWQARTS